MDQTSTAVMWLQGLDHVHAESAKVYINVLKNNK